MERIRTTKPQSLARPAGPSVGMSMGYGSSASAGARPAVSPEPVAESEPPRPALAKTVVVATVMTLVVAAVVVALGLPLVQGSDSTRSAQKTALKAASPYRNYQPPTPSSALPAATPLAAKVQTLKAGADTEQETALQRAAECRYRSPVFVHTLQEEESLGEVAGTYGVRVRDLMQLNPELAKGGVSVGTPVRVCPELPPRRQELVWHTAVPGDTWARLAARYEQRETALRRANPSVEGVEGIGPEAGERLAVPRRGKIIPGFPTGEGSEHEGTLHNGVALPPAPHYNLKRPAINFGSPHTVASVKRIAADYWKKSGGHVLLFGDLSRPGGGPLSGHRSHQQGRDIDIGIPLRVGERRDRFVTATGQNMHHERAWALIKELLADPNLAFVFVDMSVQAELYNYALRQGEDESFLREVFQYPRVPRDRYGVIRHFRGHVDHLHVRFRE